MAIPKTSIVFVGAGGGTEVAAEHWQRFTIPIQRGVRAGGFSVLMQGEAIRKLENPVTIKITTPNETMRGKSELELEGWNIIGWEPHKHTNAKRGEGQPEDLNNTIYRIDFADVRWEARYKAFTRLEGFNIRSYGGEYRNASLNGNTPWTVAEAVREVLTSAFGFDVEIDSEVDQATLLSDNLAQALGGGWFGAKIEEVMPPMLEQINADMTITTQGKILIVDRTSRPTYLRGGGDSVIEGSLDTRNAELSTPAEVEVLFRVMAEQRWEITSGSAVSSEVNSLEIENVAPDIDASNIDNFAGRITGWRNHDEFVAQNLQLFGFSFTMEEVFFKPSLVSGIAGDLRALTAQQVVTFQASDRLARQHWRTTYQVKQGTDAARLARQRFTGITFGKLADDGTAIESGSVLAEYVQQNFFGKRVEQEEYAAEFSQNFDFGEAPFISEWVDQDQLVFRVTPNDLPPSIRGAWIGHLAGEGIIFGGKDINALIDGRDVNLRANVEFDPGYKLTVYWHGTLIGRVGNVNPVHREVLPFTNVDGVIDRVTVRADGITANYQTQDAASGGGIESLTLANASDLLTRAEQVRDEIEESYRQNRAGVLTLDGIGVLAREENPVRGDVQKVEIVVGNLDAWDVRTKYVVQPGVVRAEPRFKQGQLPEKFL